MSTIVFLGPSLPHAEARNILPDADLRAPVACGDILIALQDRPERIAIIDGFFHYQAAVWHKEILLALAQGVNVYGAASMGALRAAELDAFGMRGIGQIYQAYASGLINDDDEVAIQHHGPKADYAPLSDAMVNIRVTVAKAIVDGVIGPSEADLLLQRAKQCYYPDRKMVNLLAEQRELCDWWAEHYQDQKRQDAVALLEHLRDNTLAEPNLSFQFQRTRPLEKLIKLLKLS